MKRMSLKLALTIAGLVVAAIMIVSVSYAWLVLSNNPVANGISVTIGGGRTILLAPDVTGVDSDGNIYHYPGKFEENLDFGKSTTYDYLNLVEGLSPVSTYDGVNWILPTYSNGNLNDISDFELDNTLQKAAVSGTGSYVYLDFWVVSPGSEYSLRVSCDQETGQGSYLIEKPLPVSSDDSYKLTQVSNVAAASARVGFLVNNYYSEDSSLKAYNRSTEYNPLYKKLVGQYSEPGEIPTEDTLFTIYEPNGTLHSSQDIENGSYVLTAPLACNQENNTIFEQSSADLSSRLTVQTSNRWAEATITPNSDADYMDTYQIGQTFKAAMIGHSFDNSDSAADYFYNSYLQNNLDAYIVSGKFFEDTSVLYSNCDSTTGVASPNALLEVLQGGASNDAVITKLDRNTPVRIRMFVWLEGQDVDCDSTNGIRASEIALRLELAGS